MTYTWTAPKLRQQVDADAWLRRAFMAILALYLIVCLALPLALMLSKSFTTWKFDLTRYEFQVSDGQGNWGPIETADAINARVGAFDPSNLRAGTDSRLDATKLFPEFSFRSPVEYRLRSTDGAPWLVGLDLQRTSEWQTYDSNTFRRINLRPVADTGLDNYRAYFANPALVSSIVNSVMIALAATMVTVALAFGFAYGLTRSCMRGKAMFKVIAIAPLLIPSLLPGIALIYLFGNQGMLKVLMMGNSIYGPIGILIGSVFFAFPHAMIILTTALAIADQRHYEAAEALRASPFRTFMTVTLPGARYGLVSAAFVTFTLVITDFGLPKVIGGQFNVLAVDIYKQVIGQQNFEMGAVVSVVLLLPAALAFAVDRIVQRRQVALLSSRSVAYSPRPQKGRDSACLLFCLIVTGFILAIVLTCQLAAITSFWPYDLTPSLKNYDFSKMDGGGWSAYANSIQLALLTAGIGTAVIFTGAYMSDRMEGFALGRGLFQFLAMLPMAVPGMVLGLAYIFFFNNPANPLAGLYGTMAILVISTITHFYTVGHLTAMTALKQIDREFEPVAASLRQPSLRVFGRVTVPICMPAIMDIFIYLFVNAMTTVSAVVFLYSTHTALASVAVLNMDDAGDIAAAAAMGMMILYTNAAARLLHGFVARRMLRRTQAWRNA
ncbi:MULTISPECIES: putative 2-aminoethylphosphonate ABC transporter permease subunit [unclassified Haematobacter]|uniref:putative 2-aminoethylphosphonate ABC transporter permease subunit n=1 Tax=unclassified Haematobacter TaxID=2640585 RepID=UPI0025B84EB8|nr:MULTISPECIES: putative 2-aminoethylphosphonate ABC transporter permease subunit [unclassified Haematobacter]